MSTDINKRRIIVWFSCGAASAVACKLTLSKFPRAIVVYCDTGAEHSDNERFISDCESWFGKSITRIKSEKYKSTWDVWRNRKYLAGIKGAPCSVELKIIPRLKFQKPNDVHVFGYTFDANDQNRARRFRSNFPELTVVTPLIDKKLTKSACLSFLLSEGIEIPRMYLLGFHNNNCIPCVKASSPAYWGLIRREFPKEFRKAARLSRQLGARLCRIQGKRKFIDQIPKHTSRHEMTDYSCDFTCSLARD